MIKPLPIKYQLGELPLTDYDSYGVWWVTQAVRGWRGTPPPRNDREARLALDGAHRGYPYRDPRIITLTGQAKAPSVVTREDAERRITDYLMGTRELVPIQRTDVSGRIEVAYVELDEAFDPIPYNQYRFNWSLQLAAPDPRLFGKDWVSAESKLLTEGTGGVVSTGLGVVSTTPGVVAGTTGITSTVTHYGEGTGPSQIVYELVGPGEGLIVNQTDIGSVVTFKGYLAEGQSVFINCDNQPVHEVPGASQSIPARAALMNDFNARSAVVVSGGWPVLESGKTGTFVMSGMASADATLIVHVRGASA